MLPFQQSEPVITYPSDKLITHKEYLFQQLNKWNELLVERTISYHEALFRYSENPTLVIAVQNKQAYPNGMSISDIVDVRIPALIEARAHVAVLEKMIQEEAAGTFRERWMDKSIQNPKMGVRVDDSTFGAPKQQ